MANPRGMPTLPAALIRPAAPPESGPGEGDGPDAPEPAEGQGRGAEAPAQARPRRRRPAVAATKASKRGLYLTDAVWERLQLEAIRKRTNISAVAGELLERNLPRLRIEREA